MTEPIVFISRNKIKEGMLEELRQSTKEGMALIEAGKPGTVFHNAYVNEDGSEVSFVHIFQDAEAFEHHLIGVDDRAKRGYDFIEPISMEIFGSPGDKILHMFNQIEAGGVSSTLWPQHVGGFIRLAAAR
jgi:uncharacterized protein YkuJ